jgi:hypothetical protein
MPRIPTKKVRTSGTHGKTGIKAILTKATPVGLLFLVMPLQMMQE